ncbi:hypothetical protein ACCAA_580021 [Candidatus Accumulibacter aalborgensis]|uniref:Uncharacterized protein n=1 Tax=Candidatus Accumulibacter aalborgensis TaxID=1860102 RepID=A0A1A8XWY5_9PROT|nr:hypothetical protein ACCAA_580021 [Candidatus Accumulibacter aalborgensis]
MLSTCGQKPPEIHILSPNYQVIDVVAFGEGHAAVAAVDAFSGDRQRIRLTQRRGSGEGSWGVNYRVPFFLSPFFAFFLGQASGAAESREFQ